MADYDRSVENGPVEEPAEATESEEAPVAAGLRANRRLTRRHTAHVPGPRRKPKFKATTVAEEKPVAEAPAEAEGFDEGVERKPHGLESPMTLGSVDG